MYLNYIPKGKFLDTNQSYQPSGLSEEKEPHTEQFINTEHDFVCMEDSRNKE